MTSYPSSIWSPTSKTDGVNYPEASHINDLQNEVVAIETAIKANFGGTPSSGDFLYYDGTKWTAYAAAGVVTASSTNTLTNKRIQKRQVTVTQSATPTINTDNGDIFNITGLAQAITSMTTNLSGTPVANEMIMINITDDGTARAITRGASFVSTTSATMATTTIVNKKLTEIYAWNGSAWACMYSTSAV